MHSDIEDLYHNSIILANKNKSKEVLIDADLMKMLGYIKNLKKPDIADLNSKMVELGEITRQKTLILDLDETLIHAQIISEKNKGSDF